jgi:hypothetical protein
MFRPNPIYLAKLSIAVVLAFVLLGCTGTKRLNPNSLREVHRLAIVVRVTPGPMVRVAQEDSKLNRAYPDVSPEEADRALGVVLARQVRPFEIEERVRASLVQRLPAAPPWSTAMPAVEVATALESLLIEDRTQAVSYQALAAHDADAVLQLDIKEYGVLNRGGHTGLYLKGEGRLFMLGGSTLWRSRFLIETTEGGAGAVDLVALRDGGFRDAVVGLVNQTADWLAQELAGPRQ